MCEQLIKHFNKLYKEKGFSGVIDDLHHELLLGRVIEKRDGLYFQITDEFSFDVEGNIVEVTLYKIFGE